MSEGINKLFLANPRNFLQNNILIVNIANNSNLGRFPVPKNGGDCGHKITVNIVAASDDKGTKESDGTNCPVYKIVESTGLHPFTNRFSAYYLPYHNNNFATMTLKDKADFFFTDTMNGCSFGRDNTNSPKVAHLNYTENQEDGKGIDDTAVRNKMDSLFGANGGQRFNKSDYKSGAFDFVTLVGVRSNGQWNFMWQRRERFGLGATKMGLGWKLHRNMPTDL